MSLLTALWEAITRDPKPSTLLVETISDRAELSLRCECYEHILRSEGWTTDTLQDAVQEYRATVWREVRAS